jgi:hypothetical protein
MSDFPVINQDGSVNIDGRLQFEPEGHTYTLDGKPIPGVSTILKVGGGGYYARTAQAQAAIDRGTRAHQATELMDTIGMGPFDFDADLTPYLTGWQNFLTETRAEILHIEQQVFSESLWYAGTFDRIIKLYGHKYLLDIKTGGKQKTHPVQIAAYAQAWEEMTGEHLDAGIIVYLNDSKRHFKSESWRDNSVNQEPFQPHKDTWIGYCGLFRAMGEKA